MTKQTFLHGTMILILAGMITRVLGFVNRIVIARLIGEEGVGLYMMAVPSLFLMITLAQIGLPIAISKRVAEANAVGDHQKIKVIIVSSIFIITCTSIIFTITMIFLAPIVAKYFMTDARTLYPLLAVSPIIPFIAISSVIKGYFQGMQNMKPQSIAIVLEQIVRISTVYVLMKFLLRYSIEIAAAGAIVSILIGEIASFIYLLIVFKRNKIVRIRRNFLQNLQESLSVQKQLFSIALPNTGSRLISSFSSFLEPILVSQSLALAGIKVSQATKQYGELTGYAMPLLFLPTFITNSLSIALLPSISEADAKGEKKFVHYRIRQAIRISFVSGALATIILTLYAEPILKLMYDTSNASKYIIFLAPFFIFLYIQAPLQSSLFALDLAKYAMINSFIGSFVKFALIVIFASNPAFGIMGVVIAICTSVVLISFLHLYILYKKIHFFIPFIDICKMIALFVLTFITGYQLKALFSTTYFAIHYLLFIFLILSMLYIVYILLLKMVTIKELTQLPLLNRFIK